MMVGIVTSALLSARGFRPYDIGAGYRLLALLPHAAILAIPMPFLLGGVLPLLLRLGSSTARALPGRSGLLYLVNALAAFAGGLGVQFLGFPLIGTRGVLTVVAVVGALSGAWCVLRAGPRR
jgi:hypothetical protein